MGTFTDYIHADIERFIQTPDPGTDKSVHAPRMTSDPEELNAPVPPADLALPLEIPSADSVPSEGMTRLVPDPAQALNRVRDGIADLLTSRPDLSDAVREIDQAVDALAQKTGLPAPMPSNAGNPQAPDTTRQVTQVTPWASGDPVNVSSGETQATGVILQQNPDGTYEVLTEAGTTLQKVPVEAIRSVENGRSPGMELPTKGQPTTASDANPPNKPYDMNPMRAALIKADSLQVKEGQSIEMDGKTYFVVHVGHEWTQLRDEASGDRLKVFPGELREDLESGHAVIKARDANKRAPEALTSDASKRFSVRSGSGTTDSEAAKTTRYETETEAKDQAKVASKIFGNDVFHVKQHTGVGDDKGISIHTFYQGKSIPAGSKSPKATTTVEAAIITDKDLDDALAKFCKQEGIPYPKDSTSLGWAEVMEKFKKHQVSASLQSTPAFNKWLDTFISEKSIDPEQYFEVTGPSGPNDMPYGVVIEHMKIASPQEQAALKNALIVLDFKGADAEGIKKYLRHLSQAIAASSGNGGQVMGTDIKAAWRDWNTAKGVEVVTKDKGVQTFDSLEDAKKVYPELDPEKNTKQFTWAQRGAENRMRFEDWATEERMSASVKAKRFRLTAGVHHEVGKTYTYTEPNGQKFDFSVDENGDRTLSPWEGGAALVLRDSEGDGDKIDEILSLVDGLSAAPHYHGDMQHTHEGLPGTVSDEEGHSHGNPSDVKFKTDIPSSTKKRVGDDAPGGKVRALNSVDVVGYAKDGALYCPACAAKWGVPLDGESAREAEINAVFADDAQPGDSCDTCGEYLHGAEPEGVNASITKNTKVRLKATKNPETDYFSNFKKMDGEGTAYKHNQSGEVIYKNNGTWRVIRKDKSKGSLGNGEDMYRPENLNLAMKDVHERMSASVKAKRFRLTAGVHHEVGKTYTYSEPNGQKFDFSVDENGDRTLSPWEGGAALVLRDSEGDGDKIDEILSRVDGFGAAALEAGRKGHGHGGVIKRGGKFIVVSKEGKVLGKHDNREDADKQVAAIKFRQGTIHSRIYAETSLEKVDALIKEHPGAFKKVVEENKGRAAEERAEAKKALDTLVTEGEKDPKVKKSDRFRKRRAWLTSKAETSDEDFGKQMFLYHWMRAHGKSSVGYLDGPARKLWEDLTGKEPSEKDEYKIPTFHEQAMAAALWARRGFKANLFSTLDSSSSVIELLRRAYREAKKGNPDHGSQFVSEAIEKAKADLKPEQEKLAREFKDAFGGGDFERMKTRIHSMESIGATNAKISTLEAELVPEIDFSVSPSEIIIKAGKGYAELAETVASGENAFEKELSLVEDIRSKDPDLIFLTSDAFAMDPRSKAFMSLQAGVQEMLVRLAEDGGVNDVKWEAVYPWPYDLFKKLSETGEIVLKAILPSSVESSIVPQEAVMSKENEIKAAAIAAKAKRFESIQGRLKAEILAAQGGTDAAAPQIYTFRAGLRVSKIVAHLKSLFPNLNADKDGKISIAADAVKTEVPAILQATTQYLRAALRPYPMEVDGKKYVVMTDIEENDGRKEWVPYEIKDEAGIGIEDPKEHEKIHLRFMDDDSSGKVEALLFDPAIDAATEPKAAEGAGGTHTEPPKPVTPAEVPSAEAGAVVTPPAVSAAEPPKPNTPPAVPVVPKPVTSGDGKVTVNQGSTQVTVTPAALPADASVGEGLGQVPASDSNGATLEPPSKDPIKDLASAVAAPAQIQASVFDSVPEVKFGEGWVVRRKKAQAKGAGIKSALHASTRAYPYIIQTLTGELYQVKADGIMESLPAGAGMQAAFDRGVLGVVIDAKVLPESIRSIFAAEGGEAGGAASKDKPKAEKIEVVDAEGKVKDTLPDAFGDNAEDVAALFVKLYPESKKKEEGGGKKGEGEAKLANKPKELPIIDVKPEEEAALKSAALALESHIEAGRRVIELMIDRGTLVAETKDVKAFQMAGHGLQAAIDKAFEAAISRKRLDLERMPAHQIEAIQAGLERMPSIEASMESTIQAEAKKLYSSAKGLNAIDGLTVEANDGRLGKRSGGTNIGAAFMRP